MKSSIKKQTFKAIYRLLDKVSPISGDCGKLCNSICCTCSDDTMPDAEEHPSDFNVDSLGLYLLPGEEKVFSGKEDWLDWGWIMAEEYEFPESWHGKVYFLRCKTAPVCHRKNRPLQCRVFPLAPHLDEDGNLYMIYHSGALPYSCPLIEERMPLDPSFIKATYTAWAHLLRDPLIFDLVELDSEERMANHEPVEILYP
ncbi:MAG: hypothetical protein Q4C25_09255 [Bacillota bacterium]|nr:hypothetical protein [Bacillota bacterium]